MKRKTIPGLLDVYEVTDPAEIQALARDPRLDRTFERATCPLNWLLLKRSLSVLSFGGRRFPTMTLRDDPQRQHHQAALWQSLTDRANAIRQGPDELTPLANWLRDANADPDPGPLVQQLLGQLFSTQFVATTESWDAAKTLVAAPHVNNPLKLAWWFLTGKVRRAKRLLASMVNDDLSAVNAIGIAAHNVVKSLHHMKLLYADAATRTLSPEAAAEQSLFAPLSLFRQATADGQLGNCLFSKDALFELAIGEASRQPNGRSLVFMDGTWSQCPANLWVPAMLQGVWTRAHT